MVQESASGIEFEWNNLQLNAPSNADYSKIVVIGPFNTNTPYLETTTTTTYDTIETTYTDTITQYTYQPEYLNIQAGANTYQSIPIRLYNLSSEDLAVDVPYDISAFKASQSLTNLDNAINKISSIRSYYGATTNRLEHAYNTDTNTSENTQAAESRIRDTDMAEEMVDYTKSNILVQAGQAMLAQANKDPEMVMTLLQGL